MKYSHNNRSYLATSSYSLKQATVFEVILNDNICNCIEHELNIVSIGGTSEVSVDFFRIFPFIQVLKL